MNNLLSKITSYLESLDDADVIPKERVLLLDQLADYIVQKLAVGHVDLNFICTHNSRRSHLSQIWAQASAHYFGLDLIQTYSGGTEATALYPRVADVLRLAGFEISADTGVNPHYQVVYSQTKTPLEVFSKVFDTAENPQNQFAAVMTCSHVDETCPLVPGADIRIPLYFEDPKVSDGTPEEMNHYEERSRQIATQMFHLMKRVSLLKNPKH